MRHFSSLLLVLLARKSSSFAAPSSTGAVLSSASHHHHPVAWGLRRRGGHLSYTICHATVDSSSIQQNAVQESLSIVGNNIVPATFADNVDYWNTERLDEYRVLFVLGGPGAGKGTQSEFLKEQYPCVHLSVGELLREEQTREDSPHRALIEECLVAGKIVPVEISLALLERSMKEAAEKKGRSLIYLVDGFPRNYDNLEGWNRCMTGVGSVWGVLHFTCPLSVLTDRILARAETSGRSDDNLQSAKKRFRTFEEETVPIVDTLRLVQEQQEQQTTPTMALQVQDIKGDQSIDQVWQDTQHIMNEWLANDVWTANAKLVEAIDQGNQDVYDSVSSLDMADEPSVGPITNASIEFETGTKAITSYERVVEGEAVRESRVWSHEGTRGWVNIHFSRTPA